MFRLLLCELSAQNLPSRIIYVRIWLWEQSLKSVFSLKAPGYRKGKVGEWREKLSTSVCIKRCSPDRNNAAVERFYKGFCPQWCWAPSCCLCRSSGGAGHAGHGAQVTLGRTSPIPLCPSVTALGKTAQSSSPGHSWAGLTWRWWGARHRDEERSRGEMQGSAARKWALWGAEVLQTAPP